MYERIYIDKALFQRISEGDEAAFGILFRSSLMLLEPFVRKMVRTPDDTKEVIQATFLRVWLSRDKLTDVEQPQAWLYKVAANECYTWLRKEATEYRLREAVAAEPESDTAVKQLSLKELHAIIEEAVMLLSPQRRRIYQMSRNQGMKIPEIATALDLSPNSVKNALVFSLKAIREHLRRYGHTIPLVFLIYISR
ncbi:sigma-70 family RNA polymerase sigma factor [Chitinophaga sp. 212800010-3]|jgi:RNA polymerase sigma-70 factor (ECF subfamily)|uniref:RNA polymerase sigma factor n=1 Tax=unclassified Chitinophaga TaxID=2619133 RepID=UPI002DF2788E|nr:RNA polymerase sigma-70 factor, ECF subfamily [Chitinophaga sp. 212800010-3]